MSYARGTTNFNLPQTQGTDKRDWSDTNAAFLAIDSAIKTAGDTASSASSAASTAQTRADNAYSLASTASTAAGNAATAAATADEKAVTAKSRADSAYTLANTANTTANTCASDIAAMKQSNVGGFTNIAANTTFVATDDGYVQCVQSSPVAAGYILTSGDQVLMYIYANSVVFVRKGTRVKFDYPATFIAFVS